MAQTNVQAFSGDVEISSNLAVNTNDLFVDTIEGRVGIGKTNPGIILDVGSSLSNPQIGRKYTVGSYHDADKRDSIYFGRLDGTTEDFLGMKCRVDTHTSLGYGEYSNQTKLEFYTWGSNYAGSREVMCIRGDGKVGVGSTEPSDSLHVMGGISTQNGGTPAVTPQVLFRSGASNTNSWQIKANVSDSVAGNFTIDRLDASTPTKFVVRNSGFVGIGSSQPGSQLEVHGEGQTSFASFDPSGNMGGTIALRDDAGASGSGGAIMIGTNNGFHGAIKGLLIDGSNYTGGDLGFYTRGTTTDLNMTNRMTIRQNGNVGIGRTNPDHALHVNGRIQADSDTALMMEVKRSDAGPAARIGSTDGILEIASITTTYGNETVTMQSYIDQGNQGTFAANERNLLVLQPYAGFVGIGLTNPSKKLDVDGSAGIRGYTYSRLFYSFQHTSGSISSGLNYDVSGSQFTDLSGGGSSVDDGWYHAVAMRYDSNPYEKATYQVWYYGSFGSYGNEINSGLVLQTNSGNLRMITDGDAASFPTPYLITLHKYGGRDWP